MVNKYKSPAGARLLLETYDKLLDSWGIEFEEKYVETFFGKTFILTAGDPQKPPLLLFHGVGDDLALMWVYNAKELIKHYHIIAVDTVGGPGKSEPNENYFKSFDQSRWIDDLLDALNIKETFIAGVSNGAYITMYYTLKRPGRVRKAVCMAGGVGGKAGMLRMLIFVPAALFPTEKNIGKLMKKLCGPNTDTLLKNNIIMDHWKCLLKYFNTRSMMYHKYIRFSDSDIEALRDKVLFLMGESDGLANLPAKLPETIKELERHRLKYRIVKNAGHAINHQQPELVHREIISFLK
jgi:pimeloyl-ACP methyl ester carboxylesterase